ncbi:hypothetical protein N1031_06885 [Herbiconiux moechotypicola]|uniref:Uncharacterized protein n=1 Tax=Herbiconiux moechotypicola TaxID=637393 RepID=A0ABP5QAA0_9MICO|nr:hypothetical protein [Herbiconiux moechotypicola]MCS5729481.1 hypothetical protein [Herbiconiux moechotypicola]
MGMVDGNGLIEWEGGLFDPAGDLLPRVRWAFEHIRAEGIRILLNEAGRPYGVPSDRYATSAANTQSGRSTVWYQWGRYLRGETPSAANPALGPYASEHTQGKAIDSNTSDMSARTRILRMVGMINTIASESWHSAIRFDSQVDLSAYASGGYTPISPALTDEDILLANIEDLKDVLSAILTTIATSDDATKTATIVRNYVAESQNTVATALIYPDGTAVKLNAQQDVDAAVVAHAIVYGLKPTNDKLSSPRDRFGSQLVTAQWQAFWKNYPGTKVGFDKDGL